MKVSTISEDYIDLYFIFSVMIVDNLVLQF